MSDKANRYVILATTGPYEPEALHEILRDDGEQLPVFETVDEAFDAMPRQPSHANIRVWEVIEYIESADWCGWPDELKAAARQVCLDADINPHDVWEVANADFDVIDEAARRIGMCVVSEDSGLTLLCQPIDY